MALDKIEKILGYKKKFCESIFSKVHERSNPEMFQELVNWILKEKFRDKQVILIAQDSTDIPGYSEKDNDAKIGVRTIPKKRRYKKEKVVLFKGFKLHAIIEKDTKLSISISIEPANKHIQYYSDRCLRMQNSG